MSSWYEACGKFSELENGCSTRLIGDIDYKCSAELKAAAAFIQSSNNDELIAAAANGQIDDKLAAIGKCVKSSVAPRFQFGGDEEVKLAESTWNFKKGAFAMGARS